MAYEALDSLQETLRQILKRDDDLTTRRVKKHVTYIHDKAVVLQLNLEHFPEKETIRKVANTTQEIIQYLFSPENLSSVEPTDRLSNQLGELAEELQSTAGDVVDNCKSNDISVNNVRQRSDSPAVSSSSRSTLKSEDLKVATELFVGISNRLGRFAERIKSTARELAGYPWSNYSIDNVGRLSESPAVGSSSRSSPTSKDVVVGFDEDRLEIMDRLRSYSSKLQVLPIVGMGGIGKSTLAKIVYDDTLNTFHFDIHAWVTISQDYNVESILVNLLASMKGKGNQVENGSQWEKESQINTYLKGRRYLIVMDDMWSTEAWDHVKSLFPDDNNGSRIILTTRLNDVATYPHCSSTVHMMRFLNEQQSWRLFHLKVFGDQDCPLELQDVGKKIVRGCGGLPLSIVTVAGHLSRIGRTPKLWQKIGANDGQLDTILSLSYNYLPRHLRECFLYMAGFPEDYEIHVSELIKLWVAEGFLDRQNESKRLECFSERRTKRLEGFSERRTKRLEGFSKHPNESKRLEAVAEDVLEDLIMESLVFLDRQNKSKRLEGFSKRPNESKRLEEVAENVLEDLVRQSLVLIISRKSDGKIKCCRLHPMVRDFCVRQAGQEKFLLPVMDYLPSPILRRHFLPQVLQNHQRVSVSWYDLHLKDSMHSSCTKSIICIPQRGYRPKGSIENFGSLRVLHVLRRNDHSYWDLGQVFDLIHLTYLASNIPNSIVPPAISKLRNLQTLIIYRSEVLLPQEIWGLRKLRHLIAFSFHPLPLPEKGSIPLRNFQTLSLATNFVFSTRMVEKIQHIKKLEICYSEGKFGAGYHLHDLKLLLQLEKLKLEARSLFLPHLYPVFPTSLKKLELSGWRIPWRDMTIVGSLPNLQVLKLKNFACDGEQWQTIEGEFVNLRFLQIDESNLQSWTTESNHFPRLQWLMLHRCPYLSQIPIDIGEIPTLELIELDDHNQSLMYSAKEIQEKHNALQVRLKHF